MVDSRLPSSWRPFEIESLRRLGRNLDGGYVIPDVAMRQAEFLVSFGVNDDWSFEEDFLNENRVPLHCYDDSISGTRFFVRIFDAVLRLIAKPNRRKASQLAHKTRAFFEYFWFFNNSDRRLYTERIGSSGHNATTIQDVFSRIPSKNKVFLKMDIEGSEYDVLPELDPYSARITGLAIEFHDTGNMMPRLASLLEMLGQDFLIAHIHGNNYCALSAEGIPEALEVSFVHRELIGDECRPSNMSYPLSGLDYPNRPDRADFTIAFDDV